MKKLVAIVVAAQIAGGCGGPRVHSEEAFAKASPYEQQFYVPADDVCEAAQRALLSQGYRIEKLEEWAIRARKEFQPEEEVNVMIDFDVTCKSTASGALVFANANETTYKLKKTAGATSVSVPGAGSLSMPWSKSADALVKVAGATISDAGFYRRFFDLVANYLSVSERSTGLRPGQRLKP